MARESENESSFEKFRKWRSPILKPKNFSLNKGLEVKDETDDLEAILDRKRKEGVEKIPPNPVALDINIILSNKKVCEALLNRTRSRKCNLVVSNSVLNEIKALLKNSRLPLEIRTVLGKSEITREQMEKLVRYVGAQATNIEPVLSRQTVRNYGSLDRKDHRYLRLLDAIAPHKGVLVTLDHDLLGIEDDNADKIMRPQKYLKDKANLLRKSR